MQHVYVGVTKRESPLETPTDEQAEPSMAACDNQANTPKNPYSDTHQQMQNEFTET